MKEYHVTNDHLLTICVRRGARLASHATHDRRMLCIVGRMPHAMASPTDGHRHTSVIRPSRRPRRCGCAQQQYCSEKFRCHYHHRLCGSSRNCVSLSAMAFPWAFAWSSWSRSATAARRAKSSHGNRRIKSGASRISLTPSWMQLFSGCGCGCYSMRFMRRGR